MVIFADIWEPTANSVNLSRLTTAYPSIVLVTFKLRSQFEAQSVDDNSSIDGECSNPEVLFK